MTESLVKIKPTDHLRLTKQCAGNETDQTPDSSGGGTSFTMGLEEEQQVDEVVIQSVQSDHESHPNLESLRR